MEKLFTTLLNDKGVKSYRSVLVALVLFCAWKLNEIDKRVAVLESRGVPHWMQGTAPGDTPIEVPGGGVSIGPDWPKRVARALHP